MHALPIIITPTNINKKNSYVDVFVKSVSDNIMAAAII